METRSLLVTVCGSKASRPVPLLPNVDPARGRVGRGNHLNIPQDSHNLNTEHVFTSWIEASFIVLWISDVFQSFFSTLFWVVLLIDSKFHNERGWSVACMWPVIMVEEKQRVLVRLLQALRYSVTSAFKNETLVSSPLRVIGENKLIKIASDSLKNFTYQRRFRPSYLVWVLTTTWAQFICLLGKTCKLMELRILCGKWNYNRHLTGFIL